MSFEFPFEHGAKIIELTVSGQETQLCIQKEQTSQAIELIVDDTKHHEQVLEAATIALKRRYWFLDPSWEEKVLRERFAVKLNEHTIDVFVFETTLDASTMREIAHTLKAMYDRLKNKNLWTLESIQILPRQEMNPKNGLPFRGAEFPNQRRFELYPDALKASPYRNGELSCTELQGTIAHEATHIVLEQTLESLWTKHAGLLGWKYDEDVTIEQPGGNRTGAYNEFPERCPTSYAALNPDDDRADSVVAFLFDAKALDAERSDILTEFFLPRPSETSMSINQEELVLPTIPAQIPIIVSERKKDLFGLSSIRPGKERRTISLSDFRRERGIADVDFIQKRKQST